MISVLAAAGVGLGHIDGVFAAGGLLGVGAAAGTMLVQRLIGPMLYCLAVASVLEGFARWGHGYWGGGIAIGVVAVVAIVRMAALHRGAQDTVDPPKPSARSTRPLGTLDIVVVVLGAAAAGYLWGTWGHVDFAWKPGGAYDAVIAAACALVGAYAASVFVGGSVRAGGDPTIVGSAVAFAGLVGLAVSLFIPVVGYVVLALVLLFAVRLRQRRAAKYQGLRILS